MDVYYVEDDRGIAEAVKRHLEARRCGVTILPTIEAARRALDDRPPSLLLVDWNMPDGHGDILCRWARERWENLPIILLTVRGNSRDVISGFQSGADDYVVKPFDLDVLYSRMCALLRRSGDAARDYLSCGGIRMDCRRRRVDTGAGEAALSPSEYALLLLLMRNKGRTVTREEILRRVWDDGGNFVNDNTLTVTVKRLREKLGQPDCIVTVRSIGYRMEEPV